MHLKRNISLLRQNTFDLGIRIVIANLLRLYSLLTLLYWTVKAIISDFSASYFDSALRLLPHIYTANNLVPYKDFAVVYPPGYYILVGHIFPYLSIGKRNAIIALFLLLILGLTLYVVKQYIFRSSWYDLRLFLLVLPYVSLMQDIAWDPLTLPLIILSYVLYIASVIEPNRYITLGLFFTAFVATWFRWDWILFSTLLITCIFLGFYIFELVFPALEANHKKSFGRQFHGIRTLWLALLSSCLALISFFAVQGTFRQSFQFLFTIPTSVIFSYRDEPLPIIHQFQQLRTLDYSLFVTACMLGIIIVLYIVQAIRIRKLFPFTDALLLAFPLIFLPYALGRSDWLRFLPFSLSVTIILILLMYTKRLWLQMILLLLMLVCAIPLQTRFMLPRLPWTFKPGYEQWSLLSAVSDCGALAANESAKSIFVGRVSYERFTINTASLYLLRPDLRPASKFISDEPGLQNSCIYGKQVVLDLQRAPKPTLAFIEDGDQYTHSSNTSLENMISCGKIENYLYFAKYTKIGSCSAENQTYDVRLYY